MTNIELLFLTIIITLSVTEDIRSLRLSRIINIKYQCISPECSSSTVASVSSLRNCQLACLSNQQCRTVTFDQSNNQCRMFPDIPSQYGDLIPALGIITMIAIDNRQLSAPMTTSTTTSTTSTTSTATSTTSTTTTTTTTTTTSTTTTITTTTTTSTTTTTTTTSTTTTTLGNPCAAGNLRWNTTGITILNSSTLTKPNSLHMDLNNNLYIVDEIRSVIWKLSNNFMNLAIVAGTAQSAGSNSSQLNYPNGIYVDRNGNIYISDYTNSRIQKYINGSINGITIAGITGSAGSSLNQFNAPRALASDSTETFIYVADAVNNRIIRYLSNSTSGTSGVVVAGGTGAGNANTNLNEPWGMYSSPYIGNDLLITNANGNSVIRWTPGASSGIFVVGTPGTSGATSTLFNRPSDVKIDSYQNLYITDCNNHRIQLFCYNNQTGITVAGTGTAGNSATQLNAPRTIAFDSVMNLYVSDYNNGRIQKFIKL